MKLKRIPLILFLTLIMVLQGALGLTAFAAGTNLTAGDVSGAPGDVIQVSVNLTSSGEVVAMQFDLSYDPALLTYQQISAGSLTSAFTVYANEVADNKIRVIIYNLSNTPVAAGSGLVAQLQFQVAASASTGQTCSLGLNGVTLSDAQSQAVTTTVNDGQFSVPQPADTSAPEWTNGILDTSDVTQTSLTLTWSSATDNVDVTGYNVYQGTTLLTNTPETVTSYNVTGLTAGTEYTFTVQAVDAAGNESTTGPSVTVTTMESPDTSAPVWNNGSLDTSDVTQTSLTLTWSGATDNVGVTGYNVYQGTTLLTNTPVTVTSYNVTGLTTGTEYTFTVQAMDAAGNESTTGPSITVTTSPMSSSPILAAGDVSGAPGDVIQVPVNLTSSGEVVAMQFDLSYDPALLTYQQISAGSLTSAFTVSANEVADNKIRVIIYNLSNTPVAAGSGTIAQLQFQVSGAATAEQVCALGLSEVTLSDAQSHAVTTTVNDGQFAVQQLADTSAPEWTSGSLVTSDVTQTSLTLTWSGATDNVGVTGYNVYQGTTLLTNTPVTGTSYNVTGLTAGTEYTFTVQAVDAAGNESTTGPIVTVTTMELPDTSAPEWTNGSLVTSDVTQTSLTLTWSGATDNKAVTGYKVYQGVTLLTGTPVTATSYDVTGLTEGTEYTFTVQAVDAAGNESTTGPSVTVTTAVQDTVATPTATPGSGAAVIAGTKVTLTTTTAGATIYYSLDGSNPTAASLAYTDPITVDNPITIKAIAVKDGMRDSAILTVSYTIAVPITDTTVTVSESNHELAITENTPTTTISVPSTVDNATISVTEVMNTPVSGTVTTSTLPAITIEAETSISSTPVQVAIPAGTTISAPNDWNGTIHVPTIQDKDSVTLPSESGITKTVQNVIEIGYGDVPLTFDKAVRILIPGQAGKKIGYTSNGVFTEITTLLSADSQAAGDALSPGGDGKIDVGSDMVIWTKHFTKFVTYTQQSSKSSVSSGHHSSTTKVVASTTGTAKVNPGSGGTVSLGSEAKVVIPAGALTGTSSLEVSVQKVDALPALPAGFKLSGNVYEFNVGGKSNYNFAKNVTLQFSFDPADFAAGETPAIYYYDEAAAQWVSLGGVVSGNTITVQVDHFTKFAVLAAAKQEVNTPVSLNDIAGHWAKDNISELVVLGAINGYPDGNFKPNNKISRAEFASILVNAFKPTASGGKIFTDTAGHWAKDAIATAAAAGIVNGYDADTFGPNDPITREQMAAMIVSAAKLSPATGELQFTDNGSISEWAKAAMATAVKNGIINGYPNNTVLPKGNATRAEAVTVIINALK